MDSKQFAHVGGLLEYPPISSLSLWERARVRALSGSGPRSQILRDPDNLLQNIPHLLNHLKITEPHHLNPKPLKIERPPPIMNLSRLLIMLPPIQLHRELQLHTIKIQHKRRNRHLPPKLQSRHLSCTQPLPEHLLAIGLAGAQPAGESALVEGRAILHASRPCELGWKIHCRPDQPAVPPSPVC